ncbi:uncharacterized protein LOC143216164 [Lasioglossum baleicum]|uniref:uncharacterized protein LOC143216164 n=1 Tax=Lasioglossum baleicum TaxID=434251 RepID=UPI003FCED8FB
MNRIAAISFLVFLCLTQLPDTVLTAPADPPAAIDAAILCSQNEEPTKCVSCSATCERPIPGRCNGPLCRPGCKCKLGYFKDSDGDCVSIIGCIIDNIRFQREWSVSEFLNIVKRPGIGSQQPYLPS